jgi:hypothetical protein
MFNLIPGLQAMQTSGLARVHWTQFTVVVEQQATLSLLKK